MRVTYPVRAFPAKYYFHVRPRWATDGETERWYYDDENGTLYVNLGARRPGADGPVEAAAWSTGFSMAGRSFVTLQGLSLRRYNGVAILATGLGHEVRDCLVRHAGGGIQGAEFGILRRNTVIDVDLIGLQVGTDALVEDNLVIRNFRDLFVTRNGYLSPAIRYFGSSQCVFRNNVVLESPGSGFWPDVWGANLLHYGNSVGRCGSGFYIESTMYNNLVAYNVAFDSRHIGIHLRQNAFNTVAHNYIHGTGSGVVLSTGAAFPAMETLQVVNNYFRVTGVGISAGRDTFTPGPQTRNFADRNVYDPNTIAAVANWGGVSYPTLEAFRAGTGNEPNGQAAPLPYEAMGLVAFRVAESERPWEPVEMFGNPRLDIPDLGVSKDPYFWRKGTAETTEDLRWRRGGGAIGWQLDEAGSFVRWAWSLSGADRAGAADADSRPPHDRAGPRVSRTLLQAASFPDGEIPVEGLGWWSPSLPTAPGAAVEIGLHARLDAVEATAPGGGLTIFVEWSDDTRARLERAFLAGRDDGGRDVDAARMTGSYPYARIEALVTAPDWARRMRLFAGLRACRGAVSFDGMDTLRTRAVAPEDAPAPDILRAADAGADLYETLRDAIRADDEPQVMNLVDGNPELANYRGEQSNTPLLLAAGLGRVDIIRTLIERGADVNARGLGGVTPLHAAAGWAHDGGHRAAAELLLDRGADLRAGDRNGRTVLHRAVAAGHIDFCIWLIDERGMEIDIRSRTGQTLLHVLTARGRGRYVGGPAGMVRMADALRQRGADLDARDHEGRTPLHLAEDAGLADWLVDQGADLDARDREGRSPLHTTPVAAVAARLAARGASSDARDAEGRTPLHAAVIRGQLDKIAILLDAGADTDTRDRNDRTALDLAIQTGNEAVAALLRGRAAAP